MVWIIIVKVVFKFVKDLLYCWDVNLDCDGYRMWVVKLIIFFVVGIKFFK